MRDIIDLRRLQAMSADDAAALLAARLSDPTGPHDIELFDAWLAQEDSHGLAWDRAQRALDTLDSARDDDLLAELRAEAREAGPEQGIRWTRWATAAVVAVAMAGGTYTVWNRPGAPVQVAEAPAQASTYVAAKGEVRQVRLADGSTITLDTDSAVEVAFADRQRNMTLLKGRAFFAVKHDPARPFAVRAGGHEIVALGTQFDVRLDPGSFHVVLVQGRVSVSTGSGSAPVVLNAGQQLVQSDAGKAIVSSATVEDSRTWQQGLATFRDKPLAAVADELNRYTSERLVVRDPSVAELHVSGVFRTGDVARFGRTLAEIYPVRVVRRSANEWEIVPAGQAGQKNTNAR